MRSLRNLGIPINEYHEMLQDSASSHLYGFEDLGVTDDILYLEEEGGLLLSLMPVYYIMI